MTARKPETRIIQSGRGHRYLLDGQKVPGVTTILGDGYPKPALINWAANITAGYAVDHWDELAGLNVSERLRRLERARWDTLGEAGERGREVHTLGQRYLTGEPVTAPEGLEGHLDAYVRFVEEWQPVEVAVEAAVFSREYRYGGRFDLLARLIDGMLWLLDFKTAKSGVFPDNALQLAGYRYADFYVLDGELDEQGAAIEHPMPPVDRTGIVWLRADGYDLYPLEAGHEAWEVFGAVQQVAAFATSNRDDWIGDALRPPEPERDDQPDEAAA
jgi:hypothetical protein